MSSCPTAWIVPGIGLLPNGQPRDMLRCRTWYAARLFRTHAGARDLLVVSGAACGRPTPPRTEADAMLQLLAAQGIKGAQVVPEKEATSLKTNASRSRELLKARPSAFKRVVVVSTDYQASMAAKTFESEFRGCQVHVVGSPFKTIYCGSAWKGERTEFPDGPAKLQKHVKGHGLAAPWKSYTSSSSGRPETKQAMKKVRKIMKKKA
eukprot:gnl/TRDRNA2_/TRDRNA2_198155_c0_seq1.p1 gnl/TRDRNA2_/TRDRNA2_198155_c0~~gnl/TRDRNA2_/TRDRNA2_198155_c0_seq1.p1  ORF type:complete len:207 (+),score=32.29 gnl/TRDRNA2_/TRDRNA2_198155_c0_seq1:40-660(+)